MNAAEFKSLVLESDNIVFFGGAGTSTESGIPDFRSAEGLYQTSVGGKYAPEEILSRDFFYSHPEEFYEFYKKKMIYPEAKPNPAHLALAELEKQGRLKAVITQNIDGLHQAAGSVNVLELHGSIHRNFCVDCHAFYPLEHILTGDSLVPRCSRCGGIVKPDVVLYQESLDFALLSQAAEYIRQADVLIVAGTSLTVQPAASLVRYYTGHKWILINRSATPYDHMANYVLRNSIAEVMTELMSDGQ
jgi:NAD-dependent deacetylase